MPIGNPKCRNLTGAYLIVPIGSLYVTMTHKCQQQKKGYKLAAGKRGLLKHAGCVSSFLKTAPQEEEASNKQRSGPVSRRAWRSRRRADT